MQEGLFFLCLMCSTLAMKLLVDRIKDPDQLRETARLLETENQKLHKRLEKLANRVDKLEGNSPEQLQKEIELLKRQLARARQEDAAPRSERRKPHRGKRKRDEDKKPQTGGKRSDQPELPYDEETLELDEAERTCSECGAVAVETEATEDDEIIVLVERQFKVKRIKKVKYLCTCGCSDEVAVIAKGPAKVVSRGRYSVLFATLIAVAKYAEHTPLHQQVTQMKRQGLQVTATTLWDQLVHMHPLVAPTYEAIHAAAFEESALGADETGYPMLEKGRKRWQALCLVSPRLSYFRIGTNKDTEAIVSLLTHPVTGEPFRGTLMTDGAPAYGAACRELGYPWVWGNCWSHGRRKFYEAQPDYPEADGALDLIDELFAIEKQAVRLAKERAIAEGRWGPDQEDRELPRSYLLAAREELRTTKSKGVLKDLRKWLRENASKWDGSSLNVAIRYADRRWDKLKLFVTTPEIPMHNNDSEFALRRPVMGRRRFGGVKSKLGADVAAVFYTLLESARKNGLDPVAYLLTVLMRAINSSGTVTLPWDISSGAIPLLDPKDFE
jgi:transposase